MQFSFKKIVLASGNQGKLAEFSHYFTEVGFELSIVPQSDFAVPDVAETGSSFLENAILKARHAAKYTGLPALADDSGLSVPILGGAPGIYSARYAGAQGDSAHKDAANNQKLLNELALYRDAPIPAYFVCALALVRHADDPLPIIAQGLWHGQILDAARGDGGFGYDPLFWLPELQKSSAELSKSEKNRISHRALALKGLASQLELSSWT